MSEFEHWEDARLDRIAWYVGNLRDVIDHKPVRGLCEAQAGYESAMPQLEAEVERLRGDLAKIGAAFAELFSQGLNGVVCDPAQEETGRHNCRSCHEAWKAGQEVLRAYDPKFANLLRGGPMFQPDFAIPHDHGGPHE